MAEFQIEELDYDLPGELIAQHPPDQRDAGRLLVVDRAADQMHEASVRDLPGFFGPGDLVVLNDTKVLPAKFEARRKTGGLVPGLFVSEDGPGLWRAMLEGSRRLHPGEVLDVGGSSPPDEPPGFQMTLLDHLGGGMWKVSVDPQASAEELLGRFGITPLPPYIHRSTEGQRELKDRERYQTVYARAPGAVAAPTAGLHITEEMLSAFRERGVQLAALTLHVGLGTFKPIIAKRLQDHVMHCESFELPRSTLEAARLCRQRGGRVLGVGTTTVRVLESSAEPSRAGGYKKEGELLSGTTDIFIHPPFSFQVVSSLLTNFHLPQSTLLALVMAFAGVERARRAYAEAVRNKFRFYSYGDAMLIL